MFLHVDLVNGAFVPNATTVTALLAASPGGPVVTGAAVFRGDRMVTAVDLRDVAFLRAMRQTGAVQLSFDPPPGKRFPVSARMQRFSIRGRLQPDGQTVVVRVRGSAFIVDSPEVEAGLQGTQIRQRHINRQLAAWTRDLLKRMYWQRLDVLDIGETVRERRPDGNLPAGWLDRLTHLQFRIDAEVRVIHGDRGY
ncbi:MAG: hypothetical protein IRZ18_09910 [Clostridia bacterium]|nr:hypothetical protein [Clostridia bacterium]